MKSSHSDRLLQAWASLAPFKGKPAIFNAKGKVLRTFGEIDEEAVHFTKTLLHKSHPGDVLAIQIGNHVAWPALLLAGWRRKLVILPLEQGVANRELQNALRICSAAAVIQAEAD